MSRILRRSSASADRVLLKSLQEYKRKTLNVLLWGSASIVIILLGIVFILKFTSPALVIEQEGQFLILSCIVTLIGILVIALLAKYLSYEVASLFFILLIIIALLVGETPEALTIGRSMIFLILPVTFASILLSPWAGWLVTALSCAFCIVIPLYMHLGVPNFPSILLQILVTWMIQRSTSNLQRAMVQEQKNSQSLFESQDRYRKVAESLSNAILVTDLAQNIVDCNGAALKMYGFGSKQDLIGVKGLSFAHPEEKVRASENLTQLLQEGRFINREFKSLRRDGSTFISDIYASTITDWEGKPSSYVFMIQDITERKLAENALREREENYRHLIDKLPIGVIVHQDQQIQIINPTGARILGTEAPETLIGGSILDFIHPDRRKLLETQLQAYLTSSMDTEVIEEKLVRIDGRSFDAEVVALPIIIKEKVSLMTMFTDITERKSMEAALLESEENYRRLINTLPIGVIVHQNGQIQLINPTGAKILGTKAPEPLVGTPILDFVHPDHRESIETQAQDYLTSSLNTKVIEEKLVRIDGTIFDAEIVTLPIIFEGEDSFIAMFQDITERKQAEVALRKSERNFRNLTENTADGILIVLPDGRHVYANPQACKILGYSPVQMLQTSQKDLADPALYPQLQQRLQDRLAGRSEPSNYETIIRRKDGTNFPAEIAATRTVWQDQTCDLVLFRDITDRKQAQEAIELQDRRIQEVSRQLVRVQEDEKRMLATELHDDLGQSLTSLKLMLEFSASKHATHKQQEVMRNARELLVELMDKVRNLSLDLRPAMLDDFGLFATLRWLFERFHTQTGISIKCDYNLDSAQRFPSPVEIGAFRIIQEALTNIARHAAVKEAQVNIEIDKNLAIEIADHGTGFDFSGDINQLASSGGLSGMQERARLLGGKVLIFSKKGAGTRVVAEIPLAGGTL